MTRNGLFQAFMGTSSRKSENPGYNRQQFFPCPIKPPSSRNEYPDKCPAFCLKFVHSLSYFMKTLGSSAQLYSFPHNSAYYCNVAFVFCFVKVIYSNHFQHSAIHPSYSKVQISRAFLICSAFASLQTFSYFLLTVIATLHYSF